ncbi:MAG: BamA/TamA family outer membrane protein [Ichthyobacteriaceae bacterium]|nr:BamA/TamA family outer membrane protein [Ichthyobacteriaceae bacterium]
MNLKLLLLVFMSIIVMPGFAQEMTKKEKKEAKKIAKKAKREQKVKRGEFLFSPIIAPGFTPELGGMIALGGLTSFRTDKSDTTLLRTSIPFTFAYTTTKAIVFNSVITSYWFHDKLRINGDFWYKDMPDHFWGVGYNEAYNMKKSDTTTFYHRKWWWINPRFLYQVKKNYFIGLNVDYNSTTGTNATEMVAEHKNYKKFVDKPLNSGLGLMLRYDSRDVAVDAWKGLLLDFRATSYNTAFGGDNNYEVYLFDYRQFYTIEREGKVLAWQAKIRISEGEVPYSEMSQLGNPWDLRGYTWGRYRNNDMFFFLTEYRHTFLKKKGGLSKHGAVVWVASGTIFNTETIKDNSNRWLPNFGVGYRFELQPRMSMRIDFGIGRESSGFYFNFNQAF